MSKVMEVQILDFLILASPCKSGAGGSVGVGEYAVIFIPSDRALFLYQHERVVTRHREQRDALIIAPFLPWILAVRLVPPCRFRPSAL